MKKNEKINPNEADFKDLESIESLPDNNGEVNDAPTDKVEEPELTTEAVEPSKKVAHPSHLKPQPEPKGQPPRPSAVDKAHLKPQEEPKSEQRKVKVADPKHLKPQE